MAQSGDGERKYKFDPRGADVLAFRQMIREAGYNDYVDYVSIHIGGWPSKAVDRVDIQPGFERLIRFVGARQSTGPEPVRIEILANDPATTLKRALDVTELVQSSHSFGLFRHVYKGIVSAGEDTGAEQFWCLDYDR